jgi:anti-anti-sigma regulatory factor
MKIISHGPCFSYAEACRVVGQALSEHAKRVIIDLGGAEDATTSAFAQLILLRRTLLRVGRDLCVTGLRDRTAGVFEVNRLSAVLPPA